MSAISDAKREYDKALDATRRKNDELAKVEREIEDLQRAVTQLSKEVTALGKEEMATFNEWKRLKKQADSPSPGRSFVRNEQVLEDLETKSLGLPATKATEKQMLERKIDKVEHEIDGLINQLNDDEILDRIQELKDEVKDLYAQLAKL